MNRDSSPRLGSHSLLALILLAALVATPSWADLPDPCGNSPTISHVGDMAILLDTEDSTRERRAAVANERLLWPEGKVYYTIDPAFSGERSRSLSSYLSHAACSLLYKCIPHLSRILTFNHWLGIFTNIKRLL